MLPGQSSLVCTNNSCEKSCCVTKCLLPGFAPLNQTGFKASTHRGACSWNMLLQHAPGAKFSRVYQRFHAKKVVAHQIFWSRVLLHWIKLVKYEGASSRSLICCRSVLQEQAPPCVSTWQNDPGVYCGSVFREHAPSCVPAFILPIPFSLKIYSPILTRPLSAPSPMTRIFAGF